jgi:segregation and condensation protein B
MPLLICCGVRRTPAFPGCARGGFWAFTAETAEKAKGKHRIYSFSLRWVAFLPGERFREFDLDSSSLKIIVEGLVFASSEPLSVKTLAEILQNADQKKIGAVLDELELEFRERSGGFVLERVGGGYQFRTSAQVAPWILEMKKAKPTRLSRAALETLSIVAYNQPVTRGAIEQIRGVESAATVRNLVERDLVEIVGRKDIPGRPILYGTTRRFLEVFGLPDLASLPVLPEGTGRDAQAPDNSQVPKIMSD